MTNFLGWRKATWAVVLWTVAMAVWVVSGAAGVVILLAIWVAGLVALTMVWTMSRPMSHVGRGVQDGFFVWPGRGHWRLLNLHRRGE